MRLARATKKEISQLSKLHSDLEGLAEDLRLNDIEEIEFNKTRFPILSKLGNPKKDLPDFLKQIAYQSHLIHYQRILWNLDCLLENCADPGLDYLDFKPKIKAGFDALEFLEKLLPNLDKKANKEERKRIAEILKMSRKRTLKPNNQKQA